MYKRLIGCILLANLIFSMFIPVTLSVGENLWWDENWSFRQEIILPINTSSNCAKYQPIDICIEFDDLCWTKNEKEHSVRVVFQDVGMVKDLESQIYDLNHSDENHINACSLVFLIPPEANGKEKYYVYYDDEEKSGPDYPDHVEIEESHYYYEPIQGFPFESRHFTIAEDDYIVYAVTKEGKFMGSSASQQVTKLKANTKTMEPKNGEQLVSFDLTYWYGDGGRWTESSTLEQFVSKEIFVNGNLMVKFGIVSRSSNGYFQTTAIYKYYYCPTEDKRIYAHVKHEVIKYPLPDCDDVEVFYVTLNPGDIRCSMIEDLNFGRIPPYVHIYSAEERVLTYDLHPYPERDWEVVIVRKEDVNLGSHAWVSVDEAESGKAHAVILSSTDVIQSTSDEPDGIQIQVYKSKEGFLGIKSYVAYVYVGRNSSEAGVPCDIEIPEDFVVEFDAEFFSTETGYKVIEDEASMFQSLVKYQPIHDEIVTDEEELESSEYALTVYTHLPPSLSLQLVLSRLLGKKPYISVELYRANELFASGRSSRFPLSGDMSLEFGNTKLVQTIKTMLEMVDWKNVSFFRKKQFTHLTPGRYLVKIWLENSLFGNERDFIGLQVVDVQEDTKTHIFCRPEGRISVSVLNQNETRVEDAWVYLLKDDMIVAEKQSGSDGKVMIEAPCSFKDEYKLKVVYKGFLVHKEQIQLGYITRIFPLEKTVSFDIHDLTINIRDAQGGAPAFDVDMLVTSDEMEYPMLIPAEKVSNGEYRFIDLYPAIYTLRLSYKSFEIEETVHVPMIASMRVNLYDLKVNLTDNWGLPPDASLDMALTCRELKKPVVIPGEHVSNGEYLFADLYPANYTVKLFYKSSTVEEPVCIPDVNNSGVLAMVFPIVFNVTTRVYDARGNLLENVKVVMMRGGQEVQGFTNGGGDVTFSLPPGVYVSRIYGNDGLIAEQRTDVTSGTTFNIVTTEEPLLPFIIIGLTVIMAISAAFLSYRKKDALSFLKILAVALAVIAVVSPWWMLDGSSSTPKVETSTGMFLIPPNLVTITSTPDVMAGELASLDEAFASMISMLPFLMVFGCICVVSSMLFKRYTKNRLSFVVLLLGLVVFVVSMLMFFNGMPQLMEVGVGSFLGEGNLNIGIPGAGVYKTLSCSWGPGIGFYLYLFSIVVLIFVLSFNVRQMLLRRTGKKI